jgi:hypothetical protein
MQGLRLQGTCMCIKSERKPKKPNYSWVTKELAGTCPFTKIHTQFNQVKKNDTKYVNLNTYH